ncbi:MAG: LytR/AlgR family response regulator transcription factor, partial [Butyrivibrio sp.]
MLHIDIVDDDSYICVQIERYVQSVFRNFNKEVNCYSDGKEFLEDLSETGGPDIVFMDIEMPHISGREAAARLREYVWGKDTILVFISSHTDNLIPLFALHPFDFISKPLNDNTLHDLMGRILEYIDNNQASIAVKDRRFINNVLISDIVYAEVKEGRKLILHLCDGTEMTEYAKLQAFLNDI